MIIFDINTLPILIKIAKHVKKINFSLSVFSFLCYYIVRTCLTYLSVLKNERDHCMKKSYRIKKEKEFQEIIQTRQSFANRNFIVYASVCKGQPHFRVGISVGKKVGNAVMRNRVKRQIRQSLFELKVEISPEANFIVIARPAAVQLKTEEVKKNLIHVLNLAKII